MVHLVVHKTPHFAFSHFAIENWSNFNLIFRWNDKLAAVAQKWADQCIFEHDENSARLISGFDSVGQNIYLQKISKKVPGIPFKAVKKWFDEIKYFKKRQISPFKFTSPTGHFTQVVWASTSEVKFKYF